MFQQIVKEIEAGIEGRNSSIPMGFQRMSHHIGIRKKIMSLVFGATGCLSGDTIVKLSRGKRHCTRTYTIEEAYNKLNGIGVYEGRNWDKSVKISIISYKADRDGTGIHPIQQIVKSGEKLVYKVVTDSGKTIEATSDHKFLINMQGKEEQYKTLSELNIGSTVVCTCGKESRAKGRKLKNREEIIGAYPYYYTAREKTVKDRKSGNSYRYQRFYKYRAIYDAGVNGISLESFLEEVSTNPQHTLVLSDRKMIVHHKDDDPTNNIYENLQLMTKKEHDSHHNRGISLLYGHVKEEKIISIEKVGIKMTYDIVCEEPYRNFVANEFIVHNSGKSAYVHDAWILNPFDWYMQHKHQTKTKMKVVLFSFERSKIYTITKWLSRKIYKTQGREIPIAKMLGWWPDNKLSHDEHDLILMYEDYINELCEFVDIVEGAQNPTGCYRYMKNYAESNGREEQISEHVKVYTPNNEYEIVVPIVDHMGLTKLERGYTTKKEAIDKLSEYCQIWRDHYGYSPVLVAQLTRELGSAAWQKIGEFEPTIDQIKESGTPAEAADVILSLFDPLRYNTGDMGGYDPKQFINEKTNNRHFRSVKILKNTYGADSIRYGMAFHGSTGQFKELPKKDKMGPEVPQLVKDGFWFMDNK